MNSKHFNNYNLKCLILCLILFSITPLVAQERSVDELLDLNLTELTNIQVTSASKMPQKLSEVPATVRVITAEQIKENGYFTLEEALSDLPGFQFRNILGFNSYVFQRGIPSQNNLILVLIDGIQINELNSGGFYGGGQFNLSNVERIEVVYGPASVIYGTNAISGIINIITKSALKKHDSNVNVLYGSFNTIYGDASYCYTNQGKTFGLRLSAMYKSTEKADLKGSESDNNWTDEMENFEDDYSFDTKLQFKDFTGGFNFQNKQVSRTTNQPSVGTIYRDNGTLWNIRFINAYLKYMHKFSDKLTISSIIYNRNVTVLDNTIAKIVDTAQFRYYRPNHLLGSESIIKYILKDKLVLTGGLVFEFEELADGFSITQSNSPNIKPPTPTKPRMQKNSLISLFFEPQYKLFETFQLFAGLRLDNSSVYNQVLTPRAGFIYTYKQLAVKAVYAEAFRAPKPWDYTIGLGNPDLEPEKMNSFEISGVFSASKYFRMQLSVYKNNLTNVFFKDSFGDDYRWINNGEVTTDGIEISFNYKKNRLKFYFNYTYNDTYNHKKQEVPEIGKHNANFGILYTFSHNLKLSIRCNYLGRRKNPKRVVSTGSDYIDDAMVFHSTLSLLNYHHFDFQLIIKNLFDTKYYHTSNRPPDRYRQPQRTIMLKIGLKL